FIKNLENSDFTNNSFDNWLKMIETIDELTISVVPEFIKKQFDSMFVKIDNREYLIIHIYKRAKAQLIKKILEKHSVEFNIIDVLEDSKNGLVTYEKNALFLLSISLILIFLILLIFFKNLIFAFTSTLPGLTGLLSCIAVSYFTNNGFNLMHFVSAVLLIGIGVDYGIFVTVVYKNRYSHKEFYLTLQSVLICALTTLIGFGVLSLSSNYSIFSIGSSMLIGILSALITSYYGVPFILSKITKYDFKEYK
ncbi:MAG: hypothetical protein JXB50_07140, partial [Spirochaetes bacterium]|nr:hypothetical protein [Spirochaetota bacterium]